MMNDVPMIYVPHANQIKIHESKAKYRTVVAGRRFGKSALALNEALARAFQVKNQVIWIILPLLKQAKEVYWIDPDVTKYFMPYVQEKLIKIDNSELSLHILQTNSWIRLKGSDNPDGLRGSGLDLIIWDEADDVKDLAFEIIQPSLADSPKHRMLYIGTPKGIKNLHTFAMMGDHDHIIPDFGKEIQPHKNWQTWHFTSYDNLTWEPGSFERKMFVEFIDQEKQVAAEKGKLSFFNQEYLAEFDQAAGTFFKTFSRATHMCPAVFPKAELPKYGGMDWGRSAPFCLLYGILREEKFEGVVFNRLVIYKEFYDTDRSPKEWATIIKERQNQDEVKWTKGDPAMFTKGNDNSISIADQFKMEGVTIQPASNERIGGWELIQNWLRMAPDGLPYMLISENCKNLLRTFPLQVYSETKREDLDTTLEDHAIDSLRYMVKSLKWIDADVGSTREPKLLGVTEGQASRTQKTPIKHLDLDAFTE